MGLCTSVSHQARRDFSKCQSGQYFSWCLSGWGSTGLQARVRNRGRLDNQSRGPENGVTRWRRPNSDIYSQNHHFGLVYDMIYKFLGMEAKNYKFGMFCHQCHPSVAPGDADIRPRNASRIHTCHLFTVILSISPIWRIGETNPSTKSSKILSLTHWGRVTHICVVKLTIIGWDNGLLPGRRQATIWTNAGILLISPLGTNFNGILIVIH